MQNTNSSDTILDLRGLAQPDLLIIDQSGRHWPVPFALPMRTAIELLGLQQAVEDAAGAGDAQAASNAHVDSLWEILRLRSPEATREEVLDAFDVAELTQVSQWLSFRLAGQAAGQKGAPPTPAPSPQRTTRQEPRGQTPKRTSSAPASPAES